MAAFYGCGFLSSQDTICDDAGRHYFRDCYVEGNIDIIWGNGQSLYEVRTTNLILHAKLKFPYHARQIE